MARIQIYARIRPTESRFEGIQTSENRVKVRIGEEEEKIQHRFSRTPTSKHDFRFNRVFEEDATQDEIFETVAKKMVDTFLEGYNGTVFAYGQTSSGKTHTIEGSGRRFADRGLIPRALSYIYRALERRPEEEITVHISYMEIYQDTGYDLLNPGMRPGALMVTLPKVHIAEGAGGEVVVRNLSLHLAATEEVAQSLLFQGSTCRKVAETSMNQCSSRSHSVFTITLTAKATGSEVITRSKLNLVDLAGSERVAKTGADGRILQEAKHINLSLHHLEHVIVALQHQTRHSTALSPANSRIGTSFNDKRREGPIATSHSRQGSPSQRNRRGVSGISRGSPRPGSRGAGGGHIPYRNCMLTMVLRDSLGGNCLTAMIATISAEEGNILETVSTCRFSQRVACITNKARRNEELDDKAVIQKLRQRVAELENEVSLLKQGIISREETLVTDGSRAFSDPLTDTDRQLCHQVLYGFFHGKIQNPVTAGVTTAAMFQECLTVLRGIVLHALGIPPEESEKHRNTVEELSSQMKASMNSGRRSIREAKGSPLQETAQSTITHHQTLQQMDASQTQQPMNTVHSHPKQMAETSPQEKQKKLHNTTPSPNSRLSSGFGSLHDEEWFLYDSSTSRELSKQPTPPHSQASFTQNRYQNAPGPSAIQLPQSSAEKKKTEVTSPQSRSPSKQLFSPPSHTSRQTSQINSPTQQKLPTSPTSLYHEGKVLSPRQQMALKHLGVKQAQSQASEQQKQRLTSEVQLLNLKVQEEQLRNQLTQLGEQLASQHVQVLQIQKSQAHPEQLCAERIAEQQLRIKQAKLHQKLLDTQYQLKTLETHSAGLQQFCVNKESTPVVSPPRASITEVHNELARHEMKQSKVQQQIEKLRLSQMEKQLELKEAATKRKLLALKQQLQSGGNVHSPQAHPQVQFSQLTDQGPAATFYTSSYNQPYPNRSQSMVSEVQCLHSQQKSGQIMRPPATAPVKQEQQGSDTHVPKSESARLAVSVDGKWHTQKVGPARTLTTTFQPAESNGFLNSKNYQQSTFGSLLATNKHDTTGQVVAATMTTQNSETVSPKETTTGTNKFVGKSNSNSTEMAATFSFKDVQKRHEATSTTTISNIGTLTQQNYESANKSQGSVSQEQKSSTSFSSPNTATPKPNAAKPISQTLSKPKLALPEEIKETEYMSALQRQKARVSRIRRCIAAATVIQRAWRKHNLGKPIAT